MQALILLQRYNFIRYHQTFSRCLPENSYFCSIANNFECTANRCRLVVICLKTRTFAVSQTTLTSSLSSGLCCDLLENSYFCSIANNWAAGLSIHRQLWFAWKLVLLQYRKQQVFDTCQFEYCCDLLENSYFCSIANNGPVIFAYTDELWFAWKLVLLQYRKQPVSRWIREGNCCDLLENSYFCSIANNKLVILMPQLWVVICLKTRTFAVSQTTISLTSTHSNSCDLLENSYFFSIANNFGRGHSMAEKVVICLKTRTFAVSQTTDKSRRPHRHALWFAWKLVLLQYRKQRVLTENDITQGCDLLENSYFCSIANNWNMPKKN